MPFDTVTAKEACKIAATASIRRRMLEKEVVNAAIMWGRYIKKVQDGQASWRSMPQIRLCEAVEALEDFIKYG